MRGIATIAYSSLEFRQHDPQFVQPPVFGDHCEISSLAQKPPLSSQETAIPVLYDWSAEVDLALVDRLTHH
jgi:hypothetical protein